MYKLLIADDEPRHRRGLSTLIRALRPDYEIYTAEDGESAYRIMTANAIDILITDIRMPNVDGLRLLEMLGEQKARVKIVLLSVYGQFEYARKALSLGVFDYLLKPVNRNMILAMLEKLERQLGEERASARERERLVNRHRTEGPVVLEHHFNKLLKGTLLPTERKELQGAIAGLSRGKLVVAELEEQADDAEAYSRDELEEIRAHIRFWLEEACRGAVKPVTCFSVDEVFRIVLLCGGGDAEQISLPNRLNELIGAVRQEYGLVLTIGISEPFEDMMTEAAVAYAQALEALSHSFYRGKGNTIPYSSGMHVPCKTAELQPEERKLQEALRSLDRESALSILERLLGQLLAAGTPRPSDLKQAAARLLRDQIKQLAAFVDEIDARVSDADQRIFGQNSLADLKQALSSVLLDLIDRLSMREESANREWIFACKSYIAEHYREELSLESVAQLYHFSPAYFSSMFKSAAGIGFADYLSHIRLERAKERLRLTNDKVYEIAGQVGYKDPGYFIRVFKRELGLTPEEYRRKIRRSSSGQDD